MDNSLERNITKEIMKEMATKKTTVNENFVIYFVKLLLLDPNWGITSDFVESRHNVNSFISQMTTELEEQHYPKIVTLEMQFYYSCNMEFIDTVVQRNRKEIADRLLRLQNDITKTTELHGPEEIFKLTKKIISYITLLSGLGNPTMNPVFSEALKAFNSVMDDGELMEFIQASKSVKEEQLEQLRKVVGGIRLFNRDCHKGGEGIENVPLLLKNAMTFCLSEVQSTLLSVMERVNLLTTIVDKCYIIQDFERKIKVVCVLPLEFADVYLEHTKNLLILNRQYELFIREILQNIQKLNDETEIICNKFDKMMKKIHDAVYMRIAIPANLVFPLFEALSDIWTKMQDLIVLLCKYSQIMKNLDLFSKYTFYNTELLLSILEEIEVDSCTDAERLQETASLSIVSENKTVQILNATDIPNIDKIKLEYLGFCCWKMVMTDGGLVPGNPSMGIACFEGKNYVFSTPEACREFSKKPNEFIMRVLELARMKPQLINFLGVKEHMQEVADIKELTEKEVICTSKEKEVQCLDFSELMPTNIDKTYKWNIWDLKREAILLANLSKCRTVSSQTWKTPARVTVKSQTYEKRDKNLQTKQDNYTNVSTPSNYIYGLRGRKDDEQFIVDLTRPVEEGFVEKI